MFKRIIALALAPLFSTSAFAGNLPLVPSSPNYNEPSQIVSTMNALVQQLNGNQGYAAATPIVGLGSFCQNAAAGASPQVCNGGRGTVAFTGITVTTTGSVQTLTITDSAITA